MGPRADNPPLNVSSHDFLIPGVDLNELKTAIIIFAQRRLFFHPSHSGNHPHGTQLARNGQNKNDPAVFGNKLAADQTDPSSAHIPTNRSGKRLMRIKNVSETDRPSEIQAGIAAPLIQRCWESTIRLEQGIFSLRQ